MSAQTQQMIMGLLMWVAVFGVFYFLLIRPQKKKDKMLKEMRENLSVGDKVTTIGGIIAHVAKVEENAVILEIGPNRTKVPFEKWAIGTVESKESKEA
ncbi:MULTISPECIES: preprotein translocase subunit YajC [Romboutsia]|jgi:preprotein translocase subunit YajC|uniref:Preprotein translocase, subunit YajC n=1 Tax=Romboutsia ilealis TaxID=1115758 RepID=A0A1V1I3B4_9FIRM|nr:MULTISPECIES: preprotein translocase subunit YajC [Romboutsia]MCI9061715.1 preprotein translocase subunit YajC [Romboutsia sp.]CED94705.1 Preprotein translocase, subunit YajC [Romboutsia ilealis]